MTMDDGRQKAFDDAIRDFDRQGMIQTEGVLHVAEEPLLVQRFGQIAEHMDAHGFIQILHIGSNDKDDHIRIVFFNVFAT